MSPQTRTSTVSVIYLQTLKAKGFQNGNGKPFSGTWWRKMLKVNDARFVRQQHEAPLTLGRIASGEPDEVRSGTPSFTGNF
jgi:hypothetical protein